MRTGSGKSGSGSISRSWPCASRRTWLGSWRWRSAGSRMRPSGRRGQTDALRQPDCADDGGPGVQNELPDYRVRLGRRDDGGGCGGGRRTERRGAAPVGGADAGHPDLPGREPGALRHHGAAGVSMLPTVRGARARVFAGGLTDGDARRTAGGAGAPDAPDRARPRGAAARSGTRRGGGRLRARGGRRNAPDDPARRLRGRRASATRAARWARQFSVDCVGGTKEAPRPIGPVSNGAGGGGAAARGGQDALRGAAGRGVPAAPSRPARDRPGGQGPGRSARGSGASIARGRRRAMTGRRTGMIFLERRRRDIIASIALVGIVFMSSFAHAGSNQLSWTDNSTNEANFNIERTTAADVAACQTATGFTSLASVGFNVVTFNDSVVTEGTTYCYRVNASNTGGVSAFSNIAGRLVPFSVPLAPSGLGVN